MCILTYSLASTREERWRSSEEPQSMTSVTAAATVVIPFSRRSRMFSGQDHTGGGCTILAKGRLRWETLGKWAVCSSFSRKSCAACALVRSVQESVRGAQWRRARLDRHPTIFFLSANLWGTYAAVNTLEDWMAQEPFATEALPISAEKTTTVGVCNTKHKAG